MVKSTSNELLCKAFLSNKSKIKEERGLYLQLETTFLLTETVHIHDLTSSAQNMFIQTSFVEV